MGPTRLISLVKNPKLEFLESVKLIISKYKYREQHEELLNRIAELASIADISEENFLNNRELREKSIEKDQLNILEREKFWKLFPTDIIKLKEIEEISNQTFDYIVLKYAHQSFSGRQLVFSLKDEKLIFLKASCNLKDEQVNDVFKILVNFPSLCRLSLIHNNFQTLPEKIQTFNNLEILQLTYSGIFSVPDIIGDLSSLKVLAINNNHLSTIPYSIGNLTSLKQLALGSNKKIESIPVSIGNLGLGGNPIKFLPDTIGNLTNLKRLNIKGCPILKLPESVGNLKNLEYLHIPDTKIRYLPDSMRNLKNLRFIQVADYFMSDMPKLRALVKPLKNLDVRIGFERLLKGNLVTNEIF